MTESWTVLRLLQWTEQYLRQRSVDTPRLDAELLLAHARGCERIALYTSFDAQPDETVRAAFRDLVRRRADGVPVAYLVGHREFFSRKFRVSPDVLIPRPETEFLLIKVLDLLGGRRDAAWKIADVGTGSGILAVCLALELPAAEILAVDISAAALRVAQQNAADHGVLQRIRFTEADLLSDQPPVACWDLIVSNPPYVSQTEYEQLDPEVRDQEPRTALLAGRSGVEVITRLIEQATARLRSGGWLVTEISPMIESQVRQQIEATGAFCELETGKDLSHLARVVTARRA